MALLQDSFIGIAGMIGAGKSTLAAALGAHLELPVYYEPVGDNTYLSDFYRDTAKYSFATQIYLLNRRFQQHQEIIWRGGGGVRCATPATGCALTREAHQGHAQRFSRASVQVRMRKSVFAQVCKCACGKGFRASV